MTLVMTYTVTLQSRYLKATYSQFDSRYLLQLFEYKQVSDIYLENVEESR